MNSPPDVEVPLDAGAARPHRRHQVVQDAIGDGLVKRPLVAIRPQVELPGLELHAERVGDVFDAQGGEVRLPRLRAQAGELRRLEADLVVPLGLGVGKGLEGLAGLRRHGWFRAVMLAGLALVALGGTARAAGVRGSVLLPSELRSARRNPGYWRVENGNV